MEQSILHDYFAYVQEFHFQNCVSTKFAYATFYDFHKTINLRSELIIILLLQYMPLNDVGTGYVYTPLQNKLRKSTQSFLK